MRKSNQHLFKTKGSKQNEQYLTFSGEDRRVPREAGAQVCSDRPRAQTSAKNTEKGTSNQDEARSRTGQTESTRDRKTRTPLQEPPVQQPGVVRSPPPSIVAEGKEKGKAGDGRD